jgi:hypothetical protein
MAKSSRLWMQSASATDFSRSVNPRDGTSIATAVFWSDKGAGGAAVAATSEMNRDRNVRRSWLRQARAAGVLATVFACGPAAFESTARACSASFPSIHSRSVWPAPDGVPTNGRLLVTYQGQSTSGLPTLGADVVMLDGETNVPIRVDSGNPVVVQPIEPLLPNHSYQLADRRTVPCAPQMVSCAAGSEVVPFATISTGDGPDNAPPVFAGLDAISVAPLESCSAESCCGPYDLHRVTLSWKAGVDDVAGANLSYRIYRRDGAELQKIVDRHTGTTYQGVSVCSGLVQAEWGHPSLADGLYVVRALDWAGNEDSNEVDIALSPPCSPRGGGGCGVASATARATPFVLGILALLAVLSVRGPRSRCHRHEVESTWFDPKRT